VSAGARPATLAVPLAPIYSSSPTLPWSNLSNSQAPVTPTRGVNMAVPLKAPLIRPSPLEDLHLPAREGGVGPRVSQALQQSCDVGLQMSLSRNSKVSVIRLWDIWKCANELMEVVLAQMNCEGSWGACLPAFHVHAHSCVCTCVDRAVLLSLTASITTSFLLSCTE